MSGSRVKRQWLRVATVAEELEVHPKTVLEWIAKGDLPAMVLRGTEYRVAREDMEALLVPRHGPRPRRGGVVPRAPKGVA